MRTEGCGGAVCFCVVKGPGAGDGVAIHNTAGRRWGLRYIPMQYELAVADASVWPGV